MARSRYNERLSKKRKGNWGDLPESDPIFSGTHFVFFAGPMLPVEELASDPVEEEPDLGFVSPRVPGRMKRRPIEEEG